MRQFIIWTLVLVTGLSVHAQEIEPRSYAVVPLGLHAMALSYTFSKGDVITPGNSPIQNLDVTNNVFNLGYVQTFTFFKKLARFAVSMPFGFLNGSASLQGTDTAGSRTGFYDGRIKFGMNLFGSPTLAPKDFQKFQEHTVFGASVVISVPLGQYFPSKLINLGSNRWGFKPELGISHREGRLFYEIYSGVWMYTKNTNFFKSYTQQQNSLFSFQAHVDYTFQHGKYLALNGGYADGGETSLNGMEQHDQQENWRGGITFSTPIFNNHQSLKLMLNTGIATRAGQNYTAFTVVYQFSWY